MRTHDAQRSKGRSRAVIRRRILWLLTFCLVVIGWIGLDGWLYHNLSLRLKTPDPLDRDFYTITQPFWHLVRFFPHVVGVALCYFATMAFHRRGWRYANSMLVAVLAAALLANFAEAVIGRARPRPGTKPVDVR